MRIQTDPTGKGEVPDRERAWGMARLGDNVIVRHYVADLAPEEDVQDYPETHELTWDEWVEKHADYRLDVSGRPLSS